MMQLRKLPFSGSQYSRKVNGISNIAHRVLTAIYSDNIGTSLPSEIWDLQGNQSSGVHEYGQCGIITEAALRSGRIGGTFQPASSNTSQGNIYE